MERRRKIARRKQSEQHDLRTQQIVQTSARMIQEKGFHGTTLQGVADRLDFTKAALYYYIKDKEDLLFRIHKQTLGMALEAVESIARGSLSPPAKVRAFIDGHIRMIADHPDLFAVYFNEKTDLAPEHTEAVTAMEHQIVHRLTEIVRAGMADGCFRASDPTVTAFAILGASSWVYRWYRPEGRLTIDEVSQIVQMVASSGIEGAASEASETR